VTYGAATQMIFDVLTSLRYGLSTKSPEGLFEKKRCIGTFELQG